MKAVAWLESLGQDVRYGARVLRLNPTFTIVAVLSLALGIGANTAIFQLLDAVRLRTLPVANPQQLAVVRFTNSQGFSGRVHGRYAQLTNAIWEQIRDHQEGFSSIFAWGGDEMNLAEGGEVRNARGIWVSGDFFKTLEVPALIGRTITAEDDRRGCASPPAVLSYSFWQREYGGKPDILGRKIHLEGHPFEIVGVTPANFYGIDVGHYFDVAIPLCSEPIIRGEDSMLDERHGWWLASVGRLKLGWTLAQASSQLNAISPGILEATAPAYTPERMKRYIEFRLGAFSAANGFSNMRLDYRSSRTNYETPLWTLLVIAGFVLLIACANIANLMLARASARQREIGVRFSLGASRGRLIRQLLAESFLLAAVGAACGAGLAQWLSRFLVALISTEGNRIFFDLALDWRVLGFTTGVAVLTCLFFGLAPAFRATRVSPASVLKAAARGMSGGREGLSLRRALVVSQVAFALVLLVGAMLFARSLGKLLAVDDGFQTAGILETDVEFSKLGIPPAQRQSYKLALVERLRTIPGVEGAADASVVPLSGYGWNEDIIFAGAVQRAPAEPMFSRVSPGYFSTLGIPTLAGRDFDQRDTARSAKVAVVNESFVKTLLHGANPIGARFRIQEDAGRARPMYEIVGLVKNTKYQDLREEFSPIIYVTTLQDDRPDQYAQILIRSTLPLGILTSSVKSALAQASPMLSIEFLPMKTQIHNSLLRDRLMATLSGFFGGLAALLAMIGLYGVISYTVARRTNEIGIRMALGAQRLHIVKMILREAGLMLAAGLAIGAGLTLVLGKAASTLLFGLKPHDPLTISLSTLGLAAVAILASYLPARRAARLDPVSALRDE
jgi:putative ABC transport system permease protein